MLRRHRRIAEKQRRYGGLVLARLERSGIARRELVGEHQFREQNAAGVAAGCFAGAAAAGATAVRSRRAV